MHTPKLYHLTGPDGRIYGSYEKGALGGYRGGGNRNVYGRLDCPCALHALAAPTHASYESRRVFFKDEDDAISAGFRPCHCCLPEKYAKWKNGEDPPHCTIPARSRQAQLWIQRRKPRTRKQHGGPTMTLFKANDTCDICGAPTRPRR